MKKRTFKPNSKKLIILIAFVAIVLVGVFAYSLMKESQIARCDTNKCFQEKFVKCEKAKLQTTSAYKEGATPYYEILGGSPENCKVSEKFANDKKATVCTIQSTELWNDGTEDSFYSAINLAKSEGFSGTKVCQGP